MITEKELDFLRNEVSSEMSEYRFRHTAEVEKMAQRLGELYLPSRVNELRAAALLHDITKECSTSEQIELCERLGIKLNEWDIASPKTLHARTAAALIPQKYSDFASGDIVRGVRYHTTGRAYMTLFEQIIYLADYIDMSRKFDDCVKLRNYFFDAEPEKMNREERIAHLRKTLILSFDMTVRGLINEGAPISPDSIRARNYFVCRSKKA